MGKRKNATLANGSKVLVRPEGDGLSSFDEKALFSLTEKIEKGFGKSMVLQQAGDTIQSHKQGKGRNGFGAADPKSNLKTTESEPNRGTKRDARGNFKAAERGRAENNSRPTEHKVQGLPYDRALLLQEILALGGTEADLNLVEGAASDDGDMDGEGTATGPDILLRQDVAGFFAGLGIEGSLVGDASGNEGDQRNKRNEEWEEASNSDSPGESAEPKNNLTSALPDVGNSDFSSPSDTNRLIFDARPDWHTAPLPDLPKPVLNELGPFREVVANLKDYATSLLEVDSNIYASKRHFSSSSHRFLSTIMSSGTLSDKVSALTLVVQESPVHTTKSFESLLALAKKRSRGQAVTALGALKDLLGVGVVLPADRRLRSFTAQPGLLGTLEESSVSIWKSGQKVPGQITKAHLISWAYEDWLKESYFDMLKILEGWCNDEIEFARWRAVTYVYELLREKPEQESNLLRLLVNKLGDPDKKIASRTSFLLLQLQTSHPLMKPIVIRSIETEILLRPGQSLHAKYYAINTLNQTILSTKEEDVARKLLDIYFDLFVSLLKKPDPKNALTGPVVNRKGQIQGGGGSIGKKAKSKAIKEEQAKQANEESTEKMISAVLTGVNRAFPFSKNSDLTLEKHLDTLFRITHSSNFNTSIQALMLIQQLATTNHLAVPRFYRTLYESLLDPRLVGSSKHALYLNLLFKALRSDLNIKRVKAFAKRMLQIVTLHQPPFICGVIYLLTELQRTIPGLKTQFTDPEENGEEDEEVFHDMPEWESATLQTWDNAMDPSYALNPKPPSAFYDGRKRDPEHSNAHMTCLWELIPFLTHFHPSVSMFASSLLNDEEMPPKPDLASHTLTHFLDRFVYRNPKVTSGGPRGSSIMQPLSGGDSTGILLSNVSTKNGKEPVNTEAFWRKKAEDVAAHEVFFHRYFHHVGKGKQASEKKKASKATEDEDDENEDEIWQALVDSRPEVEGNSDNSSDSDLLDLDDSDLASSLGDVELEDENAEDGEPGNSKSAIFSEFDVEVLDSEDEAQSETNRVYEKGLQTAQEFNKDEGSSRQKRRKLKNLPTFASMEEYAKMLDNDENEDF